MHCKSRRALAARLTVAVGVSHCGAGRTLGDIVAEFAVFGFGFTVAGTVLPFEIGLVGWMALMAFVFYPAPHRRLQPDTPVYWFLMQIGVIIGFATAWPANVWLIRRGIKEAM